MSGWIRQLALLAVVTGSSMASCGGGLQVTREEAKRDWEEFKDYTMVATIDHQIENELAGKKPPGGVESWNKHWLLRLKHMRMALEENRGYIDYIIKERTKAGLPPLEGYPPEDEDAGEESSK